jgi:hypothetical protein
VFSWTRQFAFPGIKGSRATSSVIDGPVTLILGILNESNDVFWLESPLKPPIYRPWEHEGKGSRPFDLRF